MPEPLVLEAPELTGNQDLTSFKTADDLAKGYLDLKGKVSGGSIDLLPEDIRKDATIMNYKTIAELAKGHIETKKLVGAKGVIVPGKDAPPEEVEKFYNTLGRPEKADGYKFTPIDGLPESLKTVPEVETAVKGIFHKAGLTAHQADIIQAEYTKMMASGVMKQQEAFNNAKKVAETALRQEWAQDYDKNISMARRVVETIGGKDAVSAFGELGNNPTVLKFLAKVGKSMSEDSIDRLGVSHLETNSGEAKRQIEKINGMTAEERKNHPYWNENHRDHTKAVKEMQELYKIAYSGAE